MSQIADIVSVRNLLAHFANCFDLKLWSELETCLADELYTDYSSLRGTPPETMSGKRFVELRKKALDPLLTHHLGGNHEIRLDGGRGEARVSMIIWRKDDTGAVFNTHCLYAFGVVKQSERWKIHSIVQTVFWSDGSSQIHQGVVK